MEGMDKAREMARRVQSGERAAMRRWLAWDDMISETCENLRILDMATLEVLIRERGGDPEKIKTKGRKRVVDKLLRGK